MQGNTSSRAASSGGRAPVRPWPRRGPGLSVEPSSDSDEDSSGNNDAKEVRDAENAKENHIDNDDGNLGEMKTKEVSGEEDQQSEFDNEADDGEVGAMEESDGVSRLEMKGAWSESGWSLVTLRLLKISTMQVLPVRETMSRAERNRRLANTKKGADESALVPEGLDPYSRKSRGSGSRPRQHIRLTNCPFRFTIQWNLSRMELQETNGIFKHNHKVSPSAFATYPSSRGVVDPIVDARVEGMLSVGAKRSKIYDYLLEHDQNVLQADVDNLVRGHHSSVSKDDDDEATARELAVFAAADRENVSTVSDTAAGETGGISMATAHMRRIYRRFSELLLVDCSHKTNRYNYQLLIFMTMNEFGEGAVVQQSLLEDNSDWHMEKAVAHFKRMHPTRIELLRVIVVDKDLNEIKILDFNFPQARVLVCHFHGIKYLKEKRAKPEYGKISADDASQVDAVVHSMVYADSEEKYRLLHESFKRICDRIGLHDFFHYFEKNWDRSQDRWVQYRRASLPHFKNHTNNRLESFFGKLKDSVDGKMSMAGCVQAIIAFDRRKENEYRYRLDRIGRQVNSNYDKEMANVLRFTSHFVAEKIAEQYTKALSSTAQYQFDVCEEGDDHILVKGSKKTYILRLDNWECNCEFAMTMKLSCRHAIAYRRENDDGDHVEEKTPTETAGGAISADDAPRIRLNPKTRRVGAPRKKKIRQTAGEKSDRKWFAQAESGRKKAGEDTLVALMEALDRDQPSLLETQTRLSGVIVKFDAAENKKPKYKRMKNPVTTNPFYILPPKLFEACQKCLPLSNTAASAIELDASQDTTAGRATENDSSMKEVVLIKDVGNFTRKQIELFTRVQNLKEAV
ncbi:hypothetical protein PHMEG_0009194 [Phytophthora megakarya]|uniref:SWIM-type domain-containing protein n=1 Tax=Phytophthora megakarya TaxID=4795 RepID=A0A225WIU7_9STRA|nr:hypothetical protein PHMEG_0009194 [Phytophthora megakarya]